MLPSGNKPLPEPINMTCINSLRPRQNRRHFAEDVFKCNFLNENVWIPIEISMKFVPKGPINNIPALVLIMAWRRSGDKPLSESMMVSLPTHIWVTRPQWVNQGPWCCVASLCHDELTHWPLDKLWLGTIYAMSHQLTHWPLGNVN